MHVDPSGQDFIALAQYRILGDVREIRIGGRPIIVDTRRYHLSLEYWRCCGDRVELFKQIPPDQSPCVLTHTVELVNYGARVWASTKDIGLYEDIELTRPAIGVAVISYDIADHGPIESILPIYQDDEVPTGAKWDNIIKNAKMYRWAEQDGFGGAFKNWPRSFYFALGTNSRTFIFQMVKEAGLPWVEMAPGRAAHPGNNAPVQNEHPTHILWPDLPPYRVLPR
jgi:hypothetical protein